jgi:hypothetical protein
MPKINDVVLVYFENKPLFFARVESMTPDAKPGWYQVRLLILQLPLATVTWILRRAYMEGEEFTMGGKPMRIEPVAVPEEPPKEGDGTETETPRPTPKVIPLAPRKK